MSDENELLIKITADSKDVIEKIEKIGEKAGGMEASLGSIASIGAAAFTALVAGAGYAINAYGKAEDSARRLALALQNQGIYTEELFKTYQEYGEELSKTTGIEHTAIENSQAILQGYLGQTAVTKELTLATLNYAAHMKIDAASAAELLGRTIGTTTNALARKGVMLSQTATQAERYAKVLEFVRTQANGQAEAENQGVNSSKGLWTALQDLAELIGKHLAPLWVQLVKEMKFWVDEATYVIHVADSLYRTVDNAFQRTAEFLQKVVFSTHSVTASYKESVDKFKELESERTKTLTTNLGVQTAEQKAAADKAQAIRNEAEKTRKSIEVAQNQLVLMEAAGESKELITLKQKEIATLKQMSSDKNRTELDALKKLHKEILAEESAASKNETQRKAGFEKEQADAKNKAKELGIKNGIKLTKEETAQLRSEYHTQLDAEKEVYKEILSQKTAAHNQYLNDQIKYGEAYAIINKAIHSNEVQGVNNATGELVQLTQSKNSTLKDIGKIASVAQIVIKTAESAENIYAGFSAIPIVGPALGIAGAAAAIAFGAEQVGNVQAAKQGGLIEGGVLGYDSVPLIAEPGELVVPKQNFNDVVGAVQGQNQMGEVVAALKGMKGQGSTHITVQGDIMAENSYIDRLVRKISDSVQYRNGQIRGKNGQVLGA